MLYYVIYDDYVKIKNKFIDQKNIIFISKKYKNPIQMLLIICKKLKSNDIICFINQPNTIILDNETTILNKFYLTLSEYKLNVSKHILWSKLKKPKNILEKYSQDKSWPRFGKYHVDTRLFIGSVKAINTFWKPYVKQRSDKTNKINKTNEENNSYHAYVHSIASYPFVTNLIKIDWANKFFYNYSYSDSLIFNDKIIINNETPKIISGREFLNTYYPTLIDKPILINISNTNIILKKNNFYKYKSNIIEISAIITLLIMLFISKKKLFVLISGLALIWEIMHYQILIKHIKAKAMRKLLYVIIDFMHMCLLGGMFYLLFNENCNTKQILFLNTTYLFVVLTFFIYKRCALTILENYVLGINTHHATMSLKKRVTYFFSLVTKYEFFKGNPKVNLEYWMKSNMYTVSLIIMSNLTCILRLIK